MAKRNNNNTQTSIRLSEALKQQIDEAAEISNMSTMEWIRRACEEKLEREKYKMFGLEEPQTAYINSNLLETIKYALTLDDVQELVLQIVEEKKKNQN